MNIGITGTSGILGSELLNLTTRNGIKTISLERTKFPLNKGLINATNYIRSLNCNVIVHCAANTNLEHCEIYPEECYKNNFILTEMLANVCRILNIQMVFISSTGVYGEHKKSPYCEYDILVPKTIHHKSKVLAEQSVQRLNPNSLIIRTGWLFGGDFNLNKNFVSNRIKEAINSRGKINSDITQEGNPTYTKDLAEKIIELIESKWSGVFNCVNEGSTSRYGYVREIVKLAKLNVQVKPTSKGFPRKAQVSKNEAAINYKLNCAGITKMRMWQESLAEYIYESSKLIEKLKQEQSSES